MSNYNSWRSLILGALHRNHSLAYSRYLQLATIRPNGRPANRTVVFRGFINQTDQLKFITDARSQKIEQLFYNSWGEACWYFPKTREQFRLLGKLVVVNGNCQDLALSQLRQSTWQELSDNARIQFTWAEPGKTRTEASVFPIEPCDKSIPVENFCLLLLQPIEVDVLELKGEPQNRYRYVYQEHGWLREEVNP
jgi:PPOX class probable FMN-dependent enzyme